MPEEWGKLSLIDPALLENLTQEERHEALAAAAAAKRAEQRAEQRALERALREKAEARQREKEVQSLSQPTSTSGLVQAIGERVEYIPKGKRDLVFDSGKDVPGTIDVDKTNAGKQRTNNITQTVDRPKLSKKEELAVKTTYLGKSALQGEDDIVAKRKKQKSSKKTTFKFRWDDTDDTFDDNDVLYKSTVSVTTQRRPNNQEISDKRDIATASSIQSKPLAKMTARDWRILRENYEIIVKGGTAPPPLRSFREAPTPDLPVLHTALLEAIEQVLRFKEPSPIQRQAIPIGLQRRDLIGIAETGSGKTVAFGVPLCHYLLNLPSRVLESVADAGPLALVMAPTRELALQIDGEFQKLLSRQRLIRTVGIVGGQQIQQQAQELRRGVHIVVGTPGRINECIDMAYMVLNQCCYIVLDEADRMIDMGFAPQIETILDACGGSLKSENEAETYQQEKEDLQKADVARHRLTAMFSATMPPEVERIAKRYLRHPAIVSVGDKDSGKNARIEQRIMFLASVSQKEKVLREQLQDRRFLREKIIVFVNEKKHAEGVGRMVERSGRACVVLHGGKTQEQREENLETFRRGNVVLVATDVAGRGLDIPDVAHVINYDLPTRSIENYTHRIGRTGRAGKEGVATSFITDEDEGIMAPLKAYLESTGNRVPERLARHPAANGNVQNNLIY
jgi:ATP-dependent RNA helicase DDX23/PRP28